MTSENSELTSAQIQDIRTRYAAGDVSMRALGSMHGVSAMTVSKIIRNLMHHDPAYTVPPRSRRLRHPSLPKEGSLAMRLTPQQVQEIRQRYTAGEGSTRSLGSEFSVSAVTISKIVRNLICVDEGYTPPTG